MEEKFLSRFKTVELPNGYYGFLLTQGEPLVCESREEKCSRFITDLGVHLGEYSFLKEEIVKIFTNLKHAIELPKSFILTHIRKEISHKLKNKGKKKRDIIKIRNKLFDILNLHGYIVEIFPPHMSIRELFTISHRVIKFL